MAQDASAAASPPPWHASFPTPQHTAPLISRGEVLSNLLSLELLLVDVRLADYEGGTIKDSLNLPAYSFYVNRGVLSPNPSKLVLLLSIRVRPIGEVR